VKANSQSKIYGQADPALTYMATGFQFSDTAATVLTGALTRASGETVASSPYAITQGTLTANSNYTISFTGSSLTITPATLIINANPQTKVYGQLDPTLTYIATGFQFTDTAASVLTGTLTRTAGETVGTYAITQGSLVSSSNYTIAFTGNSLTITPATLTIKANPQTKVYGQTDPTLSYVASGFQFTDTAATVLTGTLTRAAGEAVGTYAITQGSLISNSNYTIAFTGNSLTITAATLNVTANPQTKIYGQPDPALTYMASGFQFSDTAASVLSGTLARAPGETVAGSPYAISQGTLAANSNYTIHFTGSSLTITPATLTVKANPQTKIYGHVDPALTYMASGFQFSDTAASVLTGALTRAAGETVAGSPYAITQGTLVANNNYTLSFTGSTLTITPATLTITANNRTKTLGQTVTFAGTEFTTSGLVNGDTVTSVTLTSAGAPATATPQPLGYPIVPSAAVGTGLGNYTIVYVNGTLSVLYATGGICDGDAGHQILQPVNADGTSTFKQGSTVPAKFRVCDVNGNSIGTPGVVQSFNLVQIITGTVTQQVDETVVSTTPDTAFRWDPTGQQWIFNISTKPLSVHSTYVYQIQLNDGSTITFQFGLPK
ncbi:MAG TPA: MBG domain-containing protein, partial [Candidatus Angelobacter sp.]